MALIQICKSFCTSTFIYIIVKAKTSLKVRVDIRVRVDFRSRLKQPRIVEFSILVGILFFAIILLPCAMPSLGVKSLSNSLKLTKLY